MKDQINPSKFKVYTQIVKVHKKVRIPNEKAWRKSQDMKKSVQWITVLVMTLMLATVETSFSGEAQRLPDEGKRVGIVKKVPVRSKRVIRTQPLEVKKAYRPKAVKQWIKGSYPISQKPKAISQTIDGPYPISQKVYTNLDEALRNADKVIHLNLFNQVFEYFPDEVFTLSNLEVLKLSNMELSDIPSEITSLSKLRVLVLSNNQLQYLPYGIGDLSSLTRLDLTNNRLETIPDDIGNLSNLQVLNLSDNNISTLPEGIKDLKNLKSLRLDGNPLPNWEIVEIADALPNCKIVF